VRYNRVRSLRHLRFGAGGGVGGGGGGAEDGGGAAVVVDVVLEGGAVWPRLGGGGGTLGTFSGGIVDAEDGVADVEEGADPGAGLIGPGGTGFFTGAWELSDPGRKAGSELKIDALVSLDGLGASAKNLCITNSALADGTQVEAQLDFGTCSLRSARDTS
jgi:hypothetical protein